MKPRKPLQRRTPWTPTAEQVRRSWQWRHARPQRRPVRDGEMSEETATRLVRDRSRDQNGVQHCEIALPGVCTDSPSDFSHRKNRSQGGLWLPSHGLRACRRCHEAITNTRGHRTDYEAFGWIVARRFNPADIPVLVRGQHWALLDDCGGYQPADTNHPRGNAA